MHIMTNVRKKNDCITYGDIINSQGEIKSWQTIKLDRKKVKWLMYFQLISRVKKSIQTEVQ